MTIATMLPELNELRALRNQAPLKSWKGSLAALEQTIAAYKVKKVAPAVAEGAYDNAAKAEASTEIKGKHEKAREAIRKANAPTEKKPSAITKMKPAKTEIKPVGPRLVSLADIARELKIEPKLARAKARRSDELTKLAQGDSWAFKPADVAAVKKLLK